MHVLVVGATGALLPAVRALVARGEQVTALARHVDLPGVRPLEVDYTDRLALATALDGKRFDAALLYCPGASDAAVSVFEQATDGRVVQLLTSAVVTPPATPADLGASPRVRVVLGWRDGRWHTPAEISDAALDALRTGADAVLGAIRPWSERPA